MSINKHGVIAAATAAYAAVFIPAFHQAADSALIPSIVLAGLCGWFYGPTIGLISSLLYTLLNAGLIFLASKTSGEVFLALNPVGIFLALLGSFSTGTVKQSCDKLNELRTTLSARIEKATAELDTLVRQLIEKDEQERILIGQDLHDGVGQYLTGMLLHAEALSLRLADAEATERSMAETMTEHIEGSIQTVRQLARSLLPIQLTETTLKMALEEMAAYYSENAVTGISVVCRGDTRAIPIAIAQHLHRILHEALYRSLFNYKAANVQMEVEADATGCRCWMTGRYSKDQLHAKPELVSEIMKYRIELIGGRQNSTVPADDAYQLDITLSYNGHPK